VDDHKDPVRELGRLLDLAMVNDGWNRGWTAFTEERFPEALAWQEKTAERAESVPSMLPEVLYDLAVIRLANGEKDGALAALARAVTLNPRLFHQAQKDDDLSALEAGELGALDPGPDRRRSRWR
jgi:tetratricopeptide (TPR) repeat protein